MVGEAEVQIASKLDVPGDESVELKMRKYASSMPQGNCLSVREGEDTAVKVLVYRRTHFLGRPIRHYEYDQVLCISFEFHI